MKVFYKLTRLLNKFNPLH